MRRATATLLLCAASAAPAAAGDWPQWRGPQRDGHAAAPGATSWPRALLRDWRIPAGAGHASPVVVGDRVYLFAREGEEETLSAHDAATGRRLWRQAEPVAYTMNPAAMGHGKGPKATPAVADGRVFTFGITGTLRAFDAASGAPLWRRTFPEHARSEPEFGAAQSPLVDGGRLIVHVGGAGDGALVALDPKSGRTLWRWTGDGPGYASPVVATLGGVRQVVTLTQTKLVGVELATGALLWSEPFTTEYEQNAVTPLVVGDLVIVSGINRPLRASRVTRAGARFTVATAWENPELPLYMSSPVAHGERLFGFTHRQRGRFFAADLASGRLLWASEGRQAEHASLLLAGDALLLATSGGELLVARSGAAGFAPLASYELASGVVWAHPALGAGRLFVKDVDSLAAFRLP